MNYNSYILAPDPRWSHTDGNIRMTNRRLYRSLGGLLSAVLLVAAFLLPTLGAGAADKSYPFGHNELVVGKIDKLRRQIARCWKVPAMTQRKDFEVHVRIQLRPNGTVRTARVIDYAWIIGDPYRFSVAKSARRAILSRPCNPLLIPKARRRRGDLITLTLNPRVIFRRY